MQKRQFTNNEPSLFLIKVALEISTMRSSINDLNGDGYNMLATGV
jgi:hypothetical protein